MVPGMKIWHPAFLPITPIVDDHDGHDDDVEDDYDDINIQNEPQDESTSQSVAPAVLVRTPSPIPAIATAATVPSSNPISVGTFCHFCCDMASLPRRHECVECGAIMCEQYLPRSSGCIFLDTVEVSKEAFLCPVCSRTGEGKESPLRYAFIGFGRRKKVKMAWPMAIVNLNLESMKDDYLATTVKVEVENHYRSFKGNVSATMFSHSSSLHEFTITRQLSVSTLHMRGAAHVSECRKLAPAVEFLTLNKKAGYPANTFIIVDTHSDEYSGMLQHTGGHGGGTSTTITEILMAYLGHEFLEAMTSSYAAARGDRTVLTTVNGRQPWCDLTARARGGWRGLFMVSCGPAIRVSHHFQEVKALVER
jgi:hypothetical protein